MTKIFKDYMEFFLREDKKVNGVSETFAGNNPEWEKQNESNEGCWNCSGCSGCSGCSDCSDCSGCSGCSDCSGLKNAAPVESGTENPDAGFKVPVIENIHQKVYEAAARPDALNMGNWHTCETTHCRAGWAVFLAGAEGKKLEEKTSTLFAAMQIYHKSSPEIIVSPTRFFESSAFALADMKKCAEKEAALSAQG